MITIRKTVDTSTPLSDLGTPEDFLGLPDQTDGLLEEMLLSAIEFGEAYTNRKFFTATFEVKFSLSDFCYMDMRLNRYTMLLELSPLQSISSITIATLIGGFSGTRNVESFEVFDQFGFPAVYITDDLSGMDRDAVQQFTLTAVAGYTIDNLPRSASLALKQHVNYMHANRGDVMAESADALPPEVKRSYGPIRIMRPAF